MYVYIHTFSKLVRYTAVYMYVYIHRVSELVRYTAVYMYVYIHTVSELVRYTAVYRVCVHTYILRVSQVYSCVPCMCTYIQSLS